MPTVAIMGQCLSEFYACSVILWSFKETLTYLNRIERTCVAHNAHRLFPENVHVRKKITKLILRFITVISVGTVNYKHFRNSFLLLFFRKMGRFLGTKRKGLKLSRIKRHVYREKRKSSALTSPFSPFKLSPCVKRFRVSQTPKSKNSPESAHINYFFQFKEKTLNIQFTTIKSHEMFSTERICKDK